MLESIGVDLGGQMLEPSRNPMNPFAAKKKKLRSPNVVVFIAELSCYHVLDIR